MNTNLTVEEIDELREESIREWALAGAGLADLHRYLARSVELRLLSDRAALNEEIITLQAALSGRHEENARLSTRVGQLEEALRQAGLGRAAQADGSLINEGTKTAPVDPMDWPLPCDVKVGAGTNKKGTKLRVLVMRMETLHRMAMAALPPLTPEQHAAREALLATMGAAPGTVPAMPMIKERRRFEERG